MFIWNLTGILRQRKSAILALSVEEKKGDKDAWGSRLEELSEPVNELTDNPLPPLSHWLRGVVGGVFDPLWVNPLLPEFFLS